MCLDDFIKNKEQTEKKVGCTVEEIKEELNKAKYLHDDIVVMNNNKKSTTNIHPPMDTNSNK